MAPAANGLKDEFGVLEPLQSSGSVRGQVGELYNQLLSHEPPYTLIGHSWGAWLAWIFAAEHPEIVSHIILVGSGPFDEKYASGMMDARLNNLDAGDRQEAQELLTIMKARELTQAEFASFGRLMSKSDAYCQAPPLFEEDPLPPEPHVYESVWPEAAELRRSGKLLDLADKIKCKITFIHGTHDPHPYRGIKDVLKERGVDFGFILLDRCGHTPWKEQYAAEDFFAILKKLIKN